MSLRSLASPVAHLFVFFLLALSVLGTASQHIDRRNDYASFLRGPHRRMSDSEGGGSQGDFLSLVPGDLPTDTGWARSAATDAAKYRIVSSVRGTAAPARANQWLHLSIQCDSCDANAKPAFFARMYGPSVLSGHVTRKSDRSHDVSFLPMDAGEYYIEVVLEFSSTPEFVEYPDAAMPGYEGYLLSGFPLKVTVEPTIEAAAAVAAASPSSTSSSKKPLCSASDLLLKDYDLLTGLQVGRWQVTSKQQSPVASSSSLAPHSPVTMRYQPNRDCALVSMDESSQSFLDGCLHTYVASTYKKTVHLILVGDSVMGMQYRHLLNLSCGLPAGLQVDYIHSGGGGGLEAAHGNVTQVMAQLAADSPGSERIVVFNSGMRDIAALFRQVARRRSNDTQATSAAATAMTTSGSAAAAAEEGAAATMATQQNHAASHYRTFHYRRAMEQFATFLSTYPATISIFQTTTALWPVWGNAGAGALFHHNWSGQQSPPHLLSTHAAAQYNRIALHVFASLSARTSTSTSKPPLLHNLQVMDAYWMTLSRPDCRDTSPEMNGQQQQQRPQRQQEQQQRAVKQLLHPGDEVIAAMVQTILTVVVSQLGCIDA